MARKEAALPVDLDLEHVLASMPRKVGRYCYLYPFEIFIYK